MINIKDYTHYGTFYGIRVYFNMNTQYMIGQTAFWDFILFMASPFIETFIKIRLKYNKKYDGKVGIHLQGEINHG